MRRIFGFVFFFFSFVFFSFSVSGNGASPTFTISLFSQTFFTAGNPVPVSWTVENPSGGRIVYFVLANSSGVRVPGVLARPFARTALLASDSASFTLPQNLPNNSYRFIVYFNPIPGTTGVKVVKVTDTFTVSGGSSTPAPIPVSSPSISPTFTVPPLAQTSFTAGNPVPVSWTVQNPSGGRIVYLVLANSGGVRVPGVPAKPFARTTLLASDSASFTLPQNLPNNPYRLLVYFVPLPGTTGARVVKPTDTFTVTGGSTQVIGTSLPPITAVVTTCPQGGEAQVCLEPSGFSGNVINQGQVVQFGVQAYNMSDLFGWQFDAAYDGDAFEFVSFTEGSFLKRDGNGSFRISPVTGDLNPSVFGGLDRFTTVGATSVGSSFNGGGELGVVVLRAARMLNVSELQNQPKITRSLFLDSNTQNISGITFRPFVRGD